MLLHVLCLLWLLGVASPHGHLKKPASRSSMWRYGWETKKNYDDNQLFCGGQAHLWDVMKGKCGICGDPYDAMPRPNEWPGDYAKGIITERYTAGDVITVEVDVTANHGGYFEFRLCPLKAYMMDATKACLDRMLLEQPDGSTKYHVDQRMRAHVFSVWLRLPKSVTCDRCVLQWKWNTANSWGCMIHSGTGNKTCCVGCGQQEQFVNCADVSITGRSGSTLKRLPPIVKMDVSPHNGWKPTAIFDDPKIVSKPPLQVTRPIPTWISRLSSRRPSQQPKQPFQFNHHHHHHQARGSPISPPTRGNTPFSRFSDGPNLQKGFVARFPDSSVIITNPISGPQPSLVVPKAPSRGFSAGPNLQKGFVVGMPGSRVIITNPISGPQPSLLVPKVRSRGFFPSVRRNTRWNPGDSFVITQFSSSNAHPLLNRNARARCVVRFPKFTTFSCGENCSPQQHTCVSMNLNRDPDGACSWICKVG